MSSTLTAITGPLGGAPSPVRGFVPTGVGVGVGVAVVLVAGAAFGLASLHAPKAVAVIAAIATAVVTRTNVLIHLRDPDTARVNHVVKPYRPDPLGSARLLPHLPEAYLLMDYGRSRVLVKLPSKPRR